MTDSPKGRLSGRLPLAQQPCFLDDVPQQALIYSFGLVVPTTDPSRVSRWGGDHGNYSHIIEGRFIGLGDEVSATRFHPQTPPTHVTIDGVRWLQTRWENIPAAAADIEWLLVKSTVGSYWATPVQPGDSDAGLNAVPTKSNGVWYRLKLSKLRRDGVIYCMHGLHRWEVRVELTEQQGGRSTTALVSTRVAKAA